MKKIQNGQIEQSIRTRDNNDRAERMQLPQGREHAGGEAAKCLLRALEGSGWYSTHEQADAEDHRGCSVKVNAVVEAAEDTGKLKGVWDVGKCGPFWGTSHWATSQEPSTCSRVLSQQFHFWRSSPRKSSLIRRCSLWENPNTMEHGKQVHAQ